jgi:transposase
MTYYGALDVGVRSLALCVVDQEGDVQFERSLPTDVDTIVDCLGEFGGEIEAIGPEAGTLTQYLVYGLSGADSH